MVEHGEPDGEHAEHHQCDAHDGDGRHANHDHRHGLRHEPGQRERVAGEHVRCGRQLERHTDSRERSLGFKNRCSAGATGWRVVEHGEPDGEHAEHRQRDTQHSDSWHANHHHRNGLRGKSRQWQRLAGQHLRRGRELERHADSRERSLGFKNRCSAGATGWRVVEHGEPDGEHAEHHQRDTQHSYSWHANHHHRNRLRGKSRQWQRLAGQHLRCGGELERHASRRDRGHRLADRCSSSASRRRMVQLCPVYNRSPGGICNYWQPQHRSRIAHRDGAKQWVGPPCGRPEQQCPCSG